MFSITDGKGFQIELPNGWTVSCQFGRFNYCSNRDSSPDGIRKTESGRCENAELCAFKGDKKYGEVIGWQTPEDFLKYIQKISLLV